MESPEDAQRLIEEEFREGLSRGLNSAEAYFGVGYGAMIEEEYDKAIWAFQKSIAADPEYTLSWHFLGIVYADMGENEKAIEYFQKCIALGCRGIDLEIQEENSYFHMGWCYEDLGRLEEAKAAYRQDITHVPRHYEGYRRLGRLLQEQQAYAEAPHSPPPADAPSTGRRPSGSHWLRLRRASSLPRAVPRCPLTSPFASRYYAGPPGRSTRGPGEAPW